ncbi:MAG: hypothetical protein VX709_08450 [Pseudomonadota bacterium]|nr:hypothetical protein [Pseudomonadota bacterium]
MREIQYHMTTSSGFDETLQVRFDDEMKTVEYAVPDDLPVWTDLKVHQCPNCPLEVDFVRTCPAAAALVDLVSRSQNMNSFEEVDLEIITSDRTVKQTVTAQRAFSSFMGLILPISGCPRLEVFKPMARFHLPLANDDETMYRTISMYAVRQLFRAEQGFEVESDLKGLLDIYGEVDKVNIALNARLEQATANSATSNAIVVLGSFAAALPGLIDKSVGEIKALFRSGDE